MGDPEERPTLTAAPRARRRPTPAEVAAAADRLLPDLIAPDLRVLFCGINPGLYSAATGWHFARPGNRFWPALHQGGFTPHLVDPADQADLLGYGLGITNLAARASARADELTRDELVEGGRLLVEKVHRYRPRWVAVLGVTAYRTAFARRTARIGRQPETIGDAQLWVLPNPSGLNAHFTGPGLAAEFAALRAATLAEPGQTGS
ncbi:MULTISPECIES: G/U mismatch-specific DNA glycosylase [unclassified Plantactinospora]|uniref:G/U mismatch-specific DNA glycosylase n=1 Tax=unclassified Plantactinospora TaxID=2631981 RepID=UPI000D15F0A8|nr:G/U mismatch-specific DNA glycosylase [Plantactinospora sp. BC1]AVT40555.1 G/U mismatch-specific DNA glycosylase [Plantactinospora sp. BB1]